MKQQLVIPGGRIAVYEIAATAGNIDTNISPSAYTGIKYQILSGEVTLVCDGTVANRRIHFTKQLVAGSWCDSRIFSQAITAGQTRSVYIGGWRVSLSGFTFDSSTAGFEPAQFEISSLMRFQIGIENGVAGDSYSGRIVYKLMPEV